MREIKFRAWDGENLHGSESIKHKAVGEIKGTKFPMLCYLPMSYLLGDSNDWIWMQFTGLHDKNGKEIYEGDVLTFVFPNNGNKGTAPVVWEYGCWNVTDFKNDAGSNNIYNLYPATDCEVIGNIYKNPELL